MYYFTFFISFINFYFTVIYYKSEGWENGLIVGQRLACTTFIRVVSSGSSCVILPAAVLNKRPLDPHSVLKDAQNLLFENGFPPILRAAQKLAMITGLCIVTIVHVAPTSWLTV